jgi:mono/diheme cytochrome c family protein
MAWVQTTLLASLAVMTSLGREPPADRSGADIFATVCSMCHIQETPGLRAPSIDALRRLNAEQIKDALLLGPMDDVGRGLTDREIDNVAAFLTAPASKAPITPGRP